MNDTQIQCFLITCSTLNYTRTAEIMNYSPQAVSKIMTSLEGELGVKLFTRSKNDRSLSLSPAGKYYADTLKKTDTEKDHAIGDIRGWYNWISGQFRLGITEWVDSSGKELTDALMSFKAENPKLAFTAVCNDNDSLYNELVQGNLDAVIISSRHARPTKDVGITPLAKENLRLIAPESVCHSSKELDSSCWGATYVERPMCGFSNSEFILVTNKRLKREGLHPNGIQMMPTVMSINAALMVADCITIGDIRFGHQIKVPKIHFYDLCGHNGNSELCCMWSIRNENPNLEIFIKHLQKEFGDYTPEWDSKMPKVSTAIESTY